MIAAAIVQARSQEPLERTRQLATLIQQVTGATQWRLHPKSGRWQTHPAAKTFQALRMLVNRELGNLANLLRVLPEILRPGGDAAIISFHSGEDRVVKDAFRAGLRSGVYDRISEALIRSEVTERVANPRARSAKLRWARKVDS